MAKTVVLMANDTVGLEVARYLVANGDRIARLYLHEPDYRKRADEIVGASGCESEDVLDASLLSDAEHVSGLRELAADFIITVYWRHLLSGEVIRSARQGTVNFHPALLPVNRGYYPHVHSIVDGTPTGVTDETADTGPVWARREVTLTPLDTAYTIYHRLADEIVDLFKRTWPKIAAGQIQPTPQDESKAISHRMNEVDALDALDLDATMKVRDVVNRLRARSFGDLGFAYFDEGGQRVYVNVRLSKTHRFGTET